MVIWRGIRRRRQHTRNQQRRHGKSRRRQRRGHLHKARAFVVVEDGRSG
ncbi:MAG: hypothetical protein ACLT0Y_08660 [Christensenellales bacterium]